MAYAHMKYQNVTLCLELSSPEVNVLYRFIEQARNNRLAEVELSEPLREILKQIGYALPYQYPEPTIDKGEVIENVAIDRTNEEQVSAAFHALFPTTADPETQLLATAGETTDDLPF